MPKANITPAMRQWFEIKERYPDHLILFRMGDFYETFYEDAEKAAKVLDIALTSRNKDSDSPVPLAGVPYHALTGYLARLVRAGVKVAICDQMENPKYAKGVVKREVTRLVTAGSALDPETLDERNPNYLMGVVREGERWGFTFADLTTGEFLVGGAGDVSRLVSEVERREPAEIVAPKDAESDPAFQEFLKTVGGRMVTYMPEGAFDLKAAIARIEAQFAEDGERRMDEDKLGPALRSAGGVLKYLADTQFRELTHMSRMSLFTGDEFMVIDETAKRNLELVSSLREGGRRGSLIGLLDETVTAMGARLLKQWILYPLLSVREIAGRHDAVEELMARSVERGKIRGLLEKIHDLERLCGRISLEACNARDLIALRTSLETLPELRVLIASLAAPMIADLAGRFDELADVRVLIEESIEEEPPLSIREGRLIRDGYNADLDELRAISRKGKNYLSELEVRERERTGIAKLKIGYNSVFGYYIEISNANRALVPENYIRKQTLVNAERYITPELKDYEEKVLTAQERIVDLEYELFSEIRKRVAKEVSRIQSAARTLATLDVLVAFAHLAETYDYAKPQVDDSDVIDIAEGRHPVVERLTSGERFIPNDARLDTGENQIMIITGPNMAGKSTYIRQVALIVLMAQIGSFVPAKKASIGVVDRIFTRVGASDNLARGQSTFMVEMSEMAEILRGTTPRSLLVLDEIGRGTSTFDGLSIAWAVTEYLHEAPGMQAKTLFATHFHELVDIAREKKRVKNFNIAIIERNDKLIFLHRILPGGTSRSYGIQVAQLAGLPADVIGRAREILKNLETVELDELGRARIAAHSEKPSGAARGQLSLFGPPKPSAIEEEILSCDPQSMTPLEALTFLAQIHEKARRK